MANTLLSFSHNILISVQKIISIYMKNKPHFSIMNCTLFLIFFFNKNRRKEKSEKSTNEEKYKWEKNEIKEK